MRNLTLTRRKAYPGCLVTMKVYAEDAAVGDTMIGGVSCRKLGTLKNGEQKTFEIGDSETKVFVIADALSKNYCNDFITIPEGNEDVVLSGKNSFNPMAGNPFRFDGAVDQATAKNRKKTARKGLVVMIIAILVGIALGIIFSSMLLESNDPKTFTNNYFRITLTEEFSDYETDQFAVAYDSKKIAVLAQREVLANSGEFAAISEGEYAELWLQSANLDAQVETVEGLTHFTYSSTDEKGKDFLFSVYVLKNDNAFWVIQFGGKTNTVKGMEESILQWAKSITFVNS